MHLSSAVISSTLSDMTFSVMKYLWGRWVLAQVPGGEVVQKLSPPIRKLIDFGLTKAA
jgi:hypothetical protein